MALSTTGCGHLRAKESTVGKTALSQKWHSPFDKDFSMDPFLGLLEKSMVGLFEF
jgi:hypothetical protein